MKKALLLLGIGCLLLPAPAAQAQVSPPSGHKLNTAGATTEPFRLRCGTSTLPAADQPLIILDGFALPPATSLEQLNSNQITRIEILKGVSPTALYGSRAAHGAIIITSRIPWAVQGQQTRTYATQKAAMRSIRDQQIGNIQLLTVAESARYGAEPGMQLMLVTLKEQPQPGKSWRRPLGAPAGRR